MLNNDKIKKNCTPDIMHAKTPCGRWEPHFRVSWPLRNFVSFGALARSAATMLQRRGGLQGGSPPCTDFFLILG